MAKIVRFPEKKNDAVAQLEHILDQAKKGNIVNFVFAAELNEQENDFNLVATSWYNADVGHRQYLVAHLQANITMGIVEANLDRLE
jgi:hypothetical protein